MWILLKKIPKNSGVLKSSLLIWGDHLNPELCSLFGFVDKMKLTASAHKKTKPSFPSFLGSRNYVTSSWPILHITLRVFPGSNIPGTCAHIHRHGCLSGVLQLLENSVFVHQDVVGRTSARCWQKRVEAQTPGVTWTRPPCLR